MNTIYKLFHAIIITCFLLLSNTAFADSDTETTIKGTHIHGHIRDKTTEQHLPHVTIAVKGSDIVIVGDGTGHFDLTDLAPGEHTLVFTSVGYEPFEYRVNVRQNKITEVHVEMTETSVLLNNVVVTANKYATKQREASSMINVVSPAVFNVTSSVNMAEVLDYLTGLRVETTCSNCGFPQLRINGLEGQYSQILMDSRPMFSSLASIYGLEQLPTGMVDRAEVLRGGGSALYGSSAIGGVLNIITKEPTRNTVTLQNQSMLVGANSYDINSTLNGSFITPDRKAGAYLFGVVRNRDKYDRDNDGFSEIPKLNSSLIGVRSYYKISNLSKIVFEYHHLEEYRRGGNNITLPPHEADIAEQLRHKIDAGSIKYDFYSDDERHFGSVYASGQYLERDSYYGSGQDPKAYGRSTDLTAIAGGQYRYMMKKLLFMPADLSAGIEYSYNHLNDEMLGYNRLIAQQIRVVGGYAQNEWKNKYLGILIGARVEKHSMMKNIIVSPRANLRYTPIEALVLRLSYAHGYRAPQIYNEDLHVSAVGGKVALIESTPNLRPEYAHSISTSADYYQKIGNVETNFTLEGFFTRLNDVFTLVENGYDAQGNLLMLRSNASGATVAGINIEAKAVYKKYINAQLGFTYQQSRYTDPLKWSSEASIAPQQRMFRSPDTYGYLTLASSPFDFFTVSVTGKYTGPMLVQHLAGYIANDEEVMTPSFVDFGAKIAYEIPLYRIYTMELSLGVKNIFDAFQRDIDRGEFRDAAYIYGPSVPRSFFLGIKINI